MTTFTLFGTFIALIWFIVIINAFKRKETVVNTENEVKKDTTQNEMFPITKDVRITNGMSVYTE